jgi:hypothetical protein
VSPFDIFEIANSNTFMKNLIDNEIEKRGFIDFIRSLLQYEDVKSEKKREKIIRIIN